MYHWEATDSGVNGEDLITINWNFRWMPEPVFVSARMWGTFVITNEGGSWGGTGTCYIIERGG